jgi:hypothetical protein
VLNSLGTIPIAEIASVKIIAEGLAPYEHVFRITTQWGREYDLAADSATILNYWVDGITQAIADNAQTVADKRNSQNLISFQ